MDKVDLPREFITICGPNHHKYLERLDDER
jgi:hypothetical protein